MLSGDRLRALPFQNEGARLIRLVHSREEGFQTQVMVATANAADSRNIVPLTKDYCEIVRLEQ